MPVPALLSEPERRAPGGDCVSVPDSIPFAATAAGSRLDATGGSASGGAMAGLRMTRVEGIALRT